MRHNHMQQEIFHVFLESRAALYIGDCREFNMSILDNSQEVYELTQKHFESILAWL